MKPYAFKSKAISNDMQDIVTQKYLDGQDSVAHPENPIRGGAKSVIFLNRGGGGGSCHV